MTSFGATVCRRFCIELILGSFIMLLGIVTAASAEPPSIVIVSGPVYKAVLTTGAMPRIVLTSQQETFFRLPVVSGLSTPSNEEVISEIRILPLTTGSTGVKTLTATATSSLWQSRRFVWKFFADHIEFRQFANGEHPIERSYFFSNGVSGYFDDGTSAGIQSNTIIDADRYFAPNPNFMNQLVHTIEQPQSLGVAASPNTEPMSRAATSRLFSPPPLALSFGHGDLWSSVGIGTLPGQYQFNGLEFSGEHYAGASFWVDYQGRLKTGEFASPVAAIHFGHSGIDAMKMYVRWMDASGFSTHRTIADATWHRLPIFCGWAEQTAIAGSEAGSGTTTGDVHANSLATQANYTKWVNELVQRGIPVGTVVIDDKWMKTYGGLEIDEQKWPDMKGFIDEQHAHGRHVLLWIPVAQGEGLPEKWIVRGLEKQHGLSDVSNPEYEAYLRKQIRYLVGEIGVDGFKEDWIGAPRNFSHAQQHADLFGMEFVRRFQSILFEEAHQVKPDAMIETQTPNPLFRDSSDVLRLNDIYSGTRDVVEVMKLRAQIAHLAGWALVDTDNASTTTLAEWWKYMQAQPRIGIPSLYFVTETAVTHEKPTDLQWRELGLLWTKYRANQVTTAAKAGSVQSDK